MKKIYQKLKQFKGFKLSHLPNKPEEEHQLKPISDTNCHMLIYGTSGSGKISFLKYYLDQTKSKFIVFGRDEPELSDNYVPLLQLENIETVKLANKTVILDDAGAFKQLRTKVEDLSGLVDTIVYEFFYFAHLVKDVLPVVRKNCF